MKNFKIVMILVAAVAMFCSCGDPEAPTATFADANGLTEMTFDLANASVDVNATLTANDAKGLKSIKITRTMYDANNEVLGTPFDEYDIPDYEGLTEYSAKFEETLAKADVKDAAKVVYEAVVINKKDVQKEATYTVNVVAPSFTEGTFEWKRLGGAAATGLADFGLSWTASGKTVTAKIVPTNGAKLYILEAADYAITNITDLNAKLTSEANEYRGVNAEAPTNKTYNDVIATVYNGKTYLINVTASVGTVETQGNQIVVTGTYKAFENAVAAK
ncbi:MAG: hypothetical protein IKP45_10805 [Bacteroidales bacterium]|nr:hypothetical protein [Bacteroidales bacterium]